MTVNQKKAHGVIVPLITPLKKDETLDKEGLERLVEHVITGGVDAIFTMGTTGEFGRFDDDMRDEATALVVKYAKGRVPVFAGVSDCGTKRVLKHIRAAKAAGAEAAVVTMPYYFPNRNNQETVSFFQDILNQTELPILLYNIPVAIGSEIPLEVIAEIIKHPMLIGIKDSSGNMAYVKQVLSRFASDTVSVIIGDESVMYEGLCAGADGMVPSLANPFPSLLKRIYSAACAGDKAAIKAGCDTVDRFNKLNAFTPSWMAPNIWRKESLFQMGICDVVMAKPTVDVPASVKAEIAELIKEYKEMCR